MPKRLDKFVLVERTRHGKVVFYFRRGKGKRIRLPDPGTPEYNAAYQSALTGEQQNIVRTKDQPHTLQWLIARYRESAKWAALSVATRKQQGLFFQKAIEISGNAPYRAVTKRHIQRALDDRKATPALANNYLKAMRGLFSWALTNDHIDIDPTAGVQRLKYKTSGFPVWTLEEMAAFCDKWAIGTMERLAFELALHTGLRRGDLARLGKQHLRGSTITMKTEKTGATVTVELPKSLIKAIAETKTGDLHFLVTKAGKPFVKEGLGNWFGAAAREAGIEKNLHGIRKLSATLTVNGGATLHQLMAKYGWVTSEQAEVYTREADRVTLGMTASKLLAEQIEAVLAPHRGPGAGKRKNKSTNSKA